jgi:hypothetical protein
MIAGRRRREDGRGSYGHCHERIKLAAKGDPWKPLHHTIAAEPEMGALLPILRISGKKDDGHGFKSELASPRQV